ncbi:imm11 family protein, partial [Pseudomonas quasicaspiana]|uniref:imm11 family protein n=1 Tax=Pseudomonas quasicaspiana TaxID=2829821 RepID=UPI001E612B15
MIMAAVTAPNSPKANEFYTLMPDIRSNWRPYGVIFSNERELLTPPRRILRPPEGGFPPLRQIPQLEYDPRKGKM